MTKLKNTSKDYRFDNHPNGLAFSKFSVGTQLYIFHPDGTVPTKVMKTGKSSGAVLSSHKYSKGLIIQISPKRSCFLGLGGFGS